MCCIFLEKRDEGSGEWRLCITSDAALSDRAKELGLSTFSISAIYDSDDYFPKSGTALCSNDGHDVVHVASQLTGADHRGGSLPGEGWIREAEAR